jgi:hypothetical protein
MPECLNVTDWRASTKAEILQWLDIHGKRAKGARHLLIVRSQLRPVDVYCYLVARFGTPNGIQNFLRRDDSDNWIHWDFNVKSGEADLYFAGTLRDVHVIVSEFLTDEQWKELILAVKQDFKRVGPQKSNVLRSLEKYVVFQKKYVSLANLCADLHADILDAPPYEPPPRSAPAYSEDTELLQQAMKRVSDRANALYGNCLKLRLLIPIMAEAFINMIILVFCKDSIRDNHARYQAFVRAKIPERLRTLRENCFGFCRDIKRESELYANFMRVIDKRNFALHGNVDPMREKIEIVYFDGRRPLFNDPGDNIGKRFDHLEAIHEPQVVVKEYEGVHAFLWEITECLESRAKEFFRQVINDAYPGYEVRKRRPTRILPDHLVTGFLQGSRYDDELLVDW